MSTAKAIDLLALVHRAKLNAQGAPIGTFDGCTIGVSRFSRHPRWEVHPAGDELLQVIDGELELTLIGKDEQTSATLKPGVAFIIPRGVWHSPVPRGTVALLHVADYSGTVISNAANPRRR